MVRIVDKYDVKYTDLGKIKAQNFGKRYLIKFLNGNPENYKCNIENMSIKSKSRILDNYENGKIFILEDTSFSPALNYEKEENTKRGRYVLNSSKNSSSIFFNSSLKYFLRTLKPQYSAEVLVDVDKDPIILPKSNISNNNDKNKIEKTFKPKEYCCKKPVPPISPTPGSSSYYTNRNDNFIKRHEECGNVTTPPAYYLGYGKKYADRFLIETRDKLSPAGKKWLDKVLINLQILMEHGVVRLKLTEKGKIELEDELVKYKYNEENFLKGIECRSDDHRAFAFATHSEAYMPEEMETLPCSDLIAIGLTPDTTEWHGIGDNTWDKAGDTWAQAGSVISQMGLDGVGMVMKNCAEEGSDTIKDKIAPIVDVIEEKVDTMTEKISDIFK